MTEKTLHDISEAMRKIDVAMLSTHSDNGEIAGRPMSNNREVEYDGTSYYFTMKDTRTIADLKKDKNVGIAYKGDDQFHIALEGDAKIIDDKAAFKEHWTSSLDDWFENGPDTEGLVMIRVDATRIHYWDGLKEGEIVVT